MRKYENPEFLSENRLSQRSYYIPENEGAYIDLNGRWDFSFYKRDFDVIGGFDETLVSLEDMDFAVRLKKLGDKRGQKYGTLKRSYILTSSRKFDEFGDWYLIKNRSLTKRIFSGKDREAADEFYYDVR